MPRALRDALMFCVGLAGVVYETWTAGDARPILVGVFAAMMGLPLFIRSDEHRQEKDSD